MEPFSRHTGIVALLDRLNVDTDQIIPKQFLKLITKSGYGPYLFYDWRVSPDGTARPEFILNEPRYREASVLLVRNNFGCGSSREHAVWALRDYGFKVLIGESYADIFYNNCTKNGVLPVTLPAPEVDQLFMEAAAQPGYSVTVDLESQTILKPGGTAVKFQLDSYIRQVLLDGLDEVSLTLKHEHLISEYESKRTTGP